MVTDQIETIILIIHQNYQTFCEFYYSNHPFEVNLRRLSCAEALNDDFLTQMFIYINSLTQTQSAIIGKGLLKYSEFLRMRVKQYDTAYHKVLAKSISEESEGEYPIIKVINDLMGMRIILPNVNDNYDHIKALLNCLKKQKIISRFYHRDDHKYHAFHCYFKKSNITFPWELQIWNQKDEQENVTAHLRHNQERDDILREGGK